MTGNTIGSLNSEFPLEELLSHQMLMREHIVPQLPLRDQLSLSGVSKLAYQVMKNRPFCGANNKGAYVLSQSGAEYKSVAAHPSLPLIAVLNNHTIEIRNLATCQVCRTLSNEYIDSDEPIAWSPDGQRLATGSRWENLLRIWSLEMEEVEQTCATDNRGSGVPAWSPDGRFIAMVGGMGEVHVWPTGRETDSLPISAKPQNRGIDYSVNGLLLPEEGLPAYWLDGKLSELADPRLSLVASSSDGKYTAFCSSDGDIQTWEWRPAKVLKRRISDNQLPITALAFSAQPQYVASGNSRGVVTLWSITTGHKVDQFQGFSCPLTSLCWSYDDRFVMGTSALHNQVRIWMVGDAPIENSWDPVLSCSPDGQQFIARNGLGCLVIKTKDLDFRNQTLRGTEAHRVPNGCWRADSEAFITAVDREGLYLWSTQTGTSRRITSDDPGRLVAVEWAPDGQSFATAHEGCQPSARVISAQTGETTGSLYDGHTVNGVDGGTISIAYNPDLTNSCASCIGMNGTVCLWDSTSDGWQTEQPNITRDFMCREAKALKWTDATYLSVGNFENHVQYDVEHNHPIPFKGGHSDHITSFALSPDQQQMASAGADGLIIVWDLYESFDRCVLSGFPGSIEEVVWSSPSEIIGRGVNGHIAVWRWNNKNFKGVMRWCSSPLRYEPRQPVDTHVVDALRSYGNSSVALPWPPSNGAMTTTD